MLKIRDLHHQNVPTPGFALHAELEVEKRIGFDRRLDRERRLDRFPDFLQRWCPAPAAEPWLNPRAGRLALSRSGTFTMMICFRYIVKTSAPPVVLVALHPVVR